MSFAPIKSPRPAEIRGGRHYVVLGVVVLAALIGSFAAWSAMADLDGAVIAEARVVVESEPRVVQHPVGGIVAEIRVRDGAIVEPGDVLVRLDDTSTRANLAILLRQRDEVFVRIARLNAEIAGRPEIIFAAELTDRSKEPSVAEMMQSEGALFANRVGARSSRKLQLHEKLAQLEQEVEGLKGQESARREELRLANEELKGLVTLEGQRLVSTPRMTSARRTVAQLQGDIAQVVSNLAQTRGKVSEVKLQMQQIDDEANAECGKELREQQARRGELEERIIAAEDVLRRVDIRSPIAGRVHQLKLHTIGGVVNAAETLMTIIPDRDRLVLEARVSPRDIDMIQVGHKADVRFTTFNQRTTPTLEATVVRVSADILRESESAKSQQPGASADGMYAIRLKLSEESVHNSGVTLLPGMLAEAFIRTEARTAASYLLKPLQDQYARAFRER